MGDVVGGILGGGPALGLSWLGGRTAFRWARRRCDAVLDEAHAQWLSRAEAEVLTAFQQALDEEDGDGRLFRQPAVPTSVASGSPRPSCR